MKSSFVVLVLLLFISPTLFAADALASAPANLVFLESTDTRGRLPQERITTCLGQLVREMQLLGREMPHILVFHVSEKAGRAAGILRPDLHHTSVRINTPADAPTALYYEVWLVGDGSPAEYTIALESILERHFDLKLTEAERRQVSARVLRFLANTVSAYGE